MIGPRTDLEDPHKVRLKGWNCDLYTVLVAYVVLDMSRANLEQCSECCSKSPGNE